jgi:hypothetical protein
MRPDFFWVARPPLGVIPAEGGWATGGWLGVPNKANLREQAWMREAADRSQSAKQSQFLPRASSGCGPFYETTIFL